MKKRLTAVLLAALLICALAGTALAEEAPDAPDITLETEVSIGFEGAVYFVEMESGGMNIDFGSHMIPPHGEQAFLPASDSSHTLRVCDRRDTPGNWTVDAFISEHESESGTDRFLAYPRLYNPTSTPGLTLNLWGVEPNQHILINGPVARKVMDAASDIEAGEYDLTAAAENTRLNIYVAEIAKIKPLAYSATITWTLWLTP